MVDYSKLIIPLDNRVVVKRIEEENKTSGGILLTSTATEKPSKGEVVGVGEKCVLGLNEGEVVLFGQYAGNILKLGGCEYVIIKETELFAVLDNE